MALDLSQYEKRGYLFEEFRMFHLRDVRMERIDWHYHDFHKLILFVSGQASYAIEGKSYNLRPGDLVVVPRGCIHCPRIEDPSPYERIILYISPEFLRGMSTEDCNLETCFDAAKENFSFVLRPEGKFDIFLNVLLQLEKTILSEGFGKNVLKRALFLQFLVEVTRASAQAQFSYVSTAHYDEKTVAILQYLNNHLTEPVSIDALAEHFYLSKYHMMRRFKAETGYTIHAYLSEKRLMLAREYIRAGMPVMQACEACGYGDYSSFSRAYRKLFSASPRGK